MWQLAVSSGLIDAFWVSSPVLVAAELWHLSVSGELLTDVWMTVSEALIAFVVSSALGVVSGLLLSRSPFWDEVMAPIIVALNSLPRIALAPLIILWCGVGVTAKVVTAFSLVYFILLVNTLGGAKNVDNDIMTIAQLMGASKRDLLWKVTLPSALPWIFAALSIALTYSLLGVIVAEILASNQGLGYLIAASAGNFDTAGVFAALVVLAIIAWAVQHRDAQARSEAAALEAVDDQRLMTPPKIRLSNIGITFRPRGREPVVAVQNISLEVETGSIVTVVGPSGCGKSTILNAVSGLLTPSSGYAEVDGRRVERCAPRCRLHVRARRHDAVAHRVAERRVRPRSAWRRQTGARSPATGCARSASKNSRGITGMNCRKACGSAWRWRAPLRSTPTSC